MSIVFGRKSVDYLLPFAIWDQKWPYLQLDGFSAQSFLPVLRKTALKYPNGNYRLLLSQFPEMDQHRRSLLTGKQLNSDRERSKP